MRLPLRLAAAFCVAVLCVACGKDPEFEGKWENEEGNFVEFLPGRKAVLGQEGYEKKDSASYRFAGDSLIIESKEFVDDGARAFNRYTWRFHSDSLFLLSIALQRDNEAHVITGEEFARRLGKDARKLVLTKKAEKKK